MQKPFKGGSISELILNMKEDIEKYLSGKSDVGINEFLKKQYTELEILSDKIHLYQKNDTNETDKELAEINNARKELEDSKYLLNIQLEQTNDRIWSVDSQLNVIFVNTNFRKDYKSAYGVSLIKGVNITASLPEPVKSLWVQRYKKALGGEKINFSDKFDFKNIPQYIETSLTPIYTGNEITGVSCLARDISQQKENEEKFKALSEVSPVSITIQANNVLLYSNKAWETLTGYAQVVLMQMPFLSIFDDDSKEIVEHHLLRNQFENIDARRANVQIITKKKTKRWIDISVIDLKYEGQMATMAVASDITEVYTLQENLKRNRANLISQIENTEARIWSIDKNYKVIIANNNFVKDYQTAFGVLLAEGSYSMENLPAELEKSWIDRYNKALAGERFVLVDEFNYENVPQYTETSFNPIKLDKNIVGVSCFSRDITNQRRYEKALEESETKFKTLVSNLPGIVYRCANDDLWTMEFISEEVEQLTGYPARDFIGNQIRSFANIIYPDDRVFVTKEVGYCIDQKQKYELKYRLIHADNSIRWVHEIGRAHYNKDFEVEWLDGVIIDITEQKKGEKALIESEEKYRDIFNSISDIIVRTNLDGIILLASPSIYDNFGYKPEEVIGKSIYPLYTDAGLREKLINKLLEKDIVKDFEVKLKAKSGKIRTVSLSSKLIKDESGRPVAIESVARDITLRKVAEQLFHERTKELNSIFDNAPMVLILIDKKGHILNINRAAVQLSNKFKSGSFELLLGEVLNCIKSINNPDGCGKGDKCIRCVVRKTLSRTFNTKQNFYQVEGSVKIVQGDKVKMAHFLISTTYIDFENDKRVLLSFDDITEMKEAQEQIRKLSTAVNQSTATIVITDIKGNIQYANPQFERSTGYSIKEVLGKNPRILKSNKTTSEEYKLLWDTILKGETWCGEFLNVRKDNTEYWESAIISPIFDESGVIDSFIAVKEDITERKRIQQELMKSEKELRQMNNEKSRFFSILAHDLRGMVGSYHAYSDLLLTHFDSFSMDEFKEQLQNLTKSSSDSLILLDNLLDWARASLGKTALSPADLDISEEIDAVLSLLNEIAVTKQILLVNNAKHGLILNADSHVLRTIIRNLVSNAIKFTPTGGKITIDANSIEKDEFEISVTDTGIGMSRSILDRLFKPGETIVQEGTNQEKGTGLGLLICDEMVRKLGGVISAESEPGKGSRFYFTIPVKSN